MDWRVLTNENCAAGISVSSKIGRILGLREYRYEFENYSGRSVVGFGTEGLGSHCEELGYSKGTFYTGLERFHSWKSVGGAGGFAVDSRE